MLYHGNKRKGVTFGENPITNSLYFTRWDDGTLLPPPEQEFIITEDDQYMLDENTTNLVTE